MEKTLEQYEIELWQIIRFHYQEISIQIDFTPEFGYLLYQCRLTIKSKTFHSQGRNLWKRYKKFIEILNRVYGPNIHVYCGEIVNYKLLE